MSDLERTIGNFEAKIARLELDVTALLNSQNEILQILHQARGGWKVMVAVGGASSAITFGLMKVLTFLGVMPR